MTRATNGHFDALLFEWASGSHPGLGLQRLAFAAPGRNVAVAGYHAADAVLERLRSAPSTTTSASRSTSCNGSCTMTHRRSSSPGPTCRARSSNIRRPRRSRIRDVMGSLWLWQPVSRNPRHETHHVAFRALIATAAVAPLVIYGAVSVGI